MYSNIIMSRNESYIYVCGWDLSYDDTAVMRCGMQGQVTC